MANSIRPGCGFLFARVLRPVIAVRIPCSGNPFIALILLQSRYVTPDFRLERTTIPEICPVNSHRTGYLCPRLVRRELRRAPTNQPVQGKPGPPGTRRRDTAGVPANARELRARCLPTSCAGLPNTPAKRRLSDCARHDDPRQRAPLCCRLAPLGQWTVWRSAW